MLRRHLLAAAAALSLLVAGQTAQAGRDVLVVELVNEPSALDPHIQWNPDSYYVYRNIFDNLVTRDDAGRIVPQIATAWRQVSDTVIEFDIRQGVTLEANPNYWGDKPTFPKAEFNAMPDVATRIANLRSGRSDLAVTLGPDQAAELKNDPRAQVLSVLTERVAYLRLNAAHGPLTDVRLRRAVAAAQQEMTFATAPVFDQRSVQALHQMLTDAGLKVRITSSDMQTYLRRATEPAADAGDFAFGRWSCACQDADGMVEPLYQTAILYGASGKLQWKPTPNESMFINRMRWVE
jgi:ABC-type transport system substrate-binding protein